MTNVLHELVEEILRDKNFTIVDLSVDHETNETFFIVVHDVHPEEEVIIKLVSNDVDGDDAMQLQFEGPAVYTDDEAKVVLNEVMEVLLAIIDKATEEGSESGIGSGSGSGSVIGSGSGSGSI